MKLPGVSVRNPMLVFILLFVTGCAPQTEFYTVPQQGANRTGVYPRFSDRPRAETEQFTSEERNRLIRSLTGIQERERADMREN